MGASPGELLTARTEHAGCSTSETWAAGPEARVRSTVLLPEEPGEPVSRLWWTVPLAGVGLGWLEPEEPDSRMWSTVLLGEVGLKLLG